MADVSLAFSGATQLPYLAMVVDGDSFQLLNVEGEIPGSQGTVAAMRALFGGDGLGLFDAFELYASSFGMQISEPSEIEGAFGDVVGAALSQLIVAQGMGGGARQWSLRAAANAYSELSLSSPLLADEASYDPELGLDSAWLPGVREEFLRAAEWEPYTLSAPAEELSAALRARFADAPVAEVDGSPGLLTGTAGARTPGSRVVVVADVPGVLPPPSGLAGAEEEVVPPEWADPIDVLRPGQTAPPQAWERHDVPVADVPVDDVPVDDVPVAVVVVPAEHDDDEEGLL